MPLRLAEVTGGLPTLGIAVLEKRGSVTCLQSGDCRPELADSL